MAFRRLIDDASQALPKRLPGKRVDFEYFDFHAQYKKCGSSALMDTYINDQVKNLYLNSIGLYSEKTTVTYTDECIVAKHKVGTRQRGVVRTNCLDCLDRTNVF